MSRFSGRRGYVGHISDRNMAYVAARHSARSGPSAKELDASSHGPLHTRRGE